MRELTRQLADEAATLGLGAELAQVLQRLGSQRLLVLLQGELGAGKSTLARGFLRSLGHKGAVPSPTYTLVEPYEFTDRTVYHLDLYRLGDADELEFLGIREVLDAIALVEWPTRSPSLFEKADLVIDLARKAAGREACFSARSEFGQTIVSSLGPGAT
ncbi:MAG: tRNA (adenosine(37)-N6)-threonylcarbamoyltransferase complex ATPase subunit type 1 TsaE [Pseudomonadota bacterium]